MRNYLFFIIGLFCVVGLSAQEEKRAAQVRYFNYTQASLLIGDENEYADVKAIVPSFRTENGIHIGNHWAVAMGLGVESFEYTVFPLYVSGYYFLNTKIVIPYVAMKGGYALSNSAKDLRLDWNSETTYDNRGGVLLNPEIGVRFHIAKADITLSAGYRYQRLESRYWRAETGVKYIHRVDYNRIAVGLGVMF